MTKEEGKLLQNFEAQLRTLIRKFQELSQEKQELEEQLRKKEQLLQAMEQQHAQLQEDFHRFKTAKLLDLSTNDVEHTQKRLAKLIREIDKCIAMLNV